MLQNKIERTFISRKIDDFKRSVMPVIVWLTAIGIIICLFNRQNHRYEYIGIAQGNEYKISSETVGTIDKVLVNLFDNVNKGDIVAKLDDSLLIAQMETARAEIKKLQNQVKATQINISTDNNSRLSDWQSRLADFEATEEKYRAESLNLKMLIETDMLEKQQLGLEVERYSKMLEVKAVSQQEYEMIKLKFDQTAKRISENEILLLKIDTDYKEAKRRHDEFVKRHPEAHGEEMIKPLYDAIHKQELVLEELRIMREKVILRAPVSGNITKVLCQAGQAVTEGELIMMISENNATQIVGYITESDTTQIKAKMPVHVARVDKPEKIAEAIITNIGATIEEIPTRLWRDPRKPEFGRAFVVSISASLALTSGQKMKIRLAN